MDAKLWMYLCYLAVSVGLTAWVGRTLFRNGLAFLEDALGDDRRAGSVNHLLVVGFHLISLGYATVAIRVAAGAVSTPASAVEALSVKVGLMLLVLGTLHFGNLIVLNRLRRRRRLESAPPPVAPSRVLPA